MLRVIHSAAIGSTSPTAQTFLNDFALFWNWTKIVDENDNIVAKEALWSDRTINVKELWFDDHCYFSISGNSITADGLTISTSPPISITGGYIFVITDTAAAAFWGAISAPSCVAVGRTISNEDGTSGMGVIFSGAGGTCSRSYGGGPGSSYITAPGSYSSSINIVQLAPYADPQQFITFADIRRVVLRRSTDGGETKLGSEHFYIIDKIALPYTIE